MALLYAMICSWAVVLRKLAARKHDRLKLAYDQYESTFRKLEQDCKSHEVSIGSPVDYPSQMKLLRLFESKEQAREHWIKAANRLAKRKRRESKLREFSGRKLPYSFGLFDMAILFKAIDFGHRIGALDLSLLTEPVRHLF